MMPSVQRRCPECGAWLTPICDGTDHTCANARCGSSWQAAREVFNTSLLGAACRQLAVGDIAAIFDVPITLIDMPLLWEGDQA